MVEIYTDGATSNNGYEDSLGGWAFVFVVDGISVYEEAGALANATNNRCELTAIIKGCQRALEFFDDEELVVLSDSAYCINCYTQEWYKNWMKNGWINSKKEPVMNKDLWKELIPFFKNPRFSFKKVKGHSLNKYNERADKLAKETKFSSIMEAKIC